MSNFVNEYRHGIGPAGRIWITAHCRMRVECKVVYQIVLADGDHAVRTGSIGIHAGPDFSSRSLFEHVKRPIVSHKPCGDATPLRRRNTTESDLQIDGGIAHKELRPSGTSG